MVYKANQVTSCCSTTIVEVLGLESLYIPLKLGVRQNRFALLLLPLLPSFLLPPYCPHMPSTHTPFTTVLIII